VTRQQQTCTNCTQTTSIVSRDNSPPIRHACTRRAASTRFARDERHSQSYFLDLKCLFSRARLLPHECIFLAHGSGPHKCIFLARGSGIRPMYNPLEPQRVHECLFLCPIFSFHTAVDTKLSCLLCRAPEALISRC
jgi:hypothetical protein